MGRASATRLSLPTERTSRSKPGRARRAILLALAVAIVAGAAGAAAWLARRYASAPEMAVPIREMTAAEYPEDPAERSVMHGRYNGRRLRLVQRDATHFDFVFEPLFEGAARITLRDVDVSLMTPALGDWMKTDPGVERIALTDREWNRQQVSFPAGSARVVVEGGDGWETTHLASAELAKNCLNAGLWELLLFTREEGRKALYYQGWFTFPLGLYRRLVERNTGRSYWTHWWKLEHWDDPEADGVRVPLGALRQVVGERAVDARHDPDERILVAGEQARKVRTTIAARLPIRWGDFPARAREITFATFAPPGYYVNRKPWRNEYHRFAELGAVTLRTVRPAGAPASELHEFEVAFRDPATGDASLFVLGGVDLRALPQLAAADYPNGFYRPMGIGVPPFFQSYDALHAEPPERGTYYSVLLGPDDLWLDHHRIALDGAVLFRDRDDGDLLHLYLLSYERHSLITHLAIPLGPREHHGVSP